jgi:hypothetical protein
MTSMPAAPPPASQATILPSGGTAAFPMSTLTLKLTGPSARGVRVPAALLRDAMSTLVDAVQQSVRLRVDGRSRAAGAAPAWLERASSFDVEIRAGSTELAMESRALAELAPERFAQQDLFGPIAAHKSCLDLFSDAIDDALGGKLDSDRYDDSLIETFTSFGQVFRHGIDRIEIVNGAIRALDKERIEGLKTLRRQIPPDQQAMVSGKLDLLRHSNRGFELHLASGETVRGVVGDRADFQALGALIGSDVLATGRATFRPSGQVLRLEADTLGAAGPNASVWSAVPRPLMSALDVRDLRRPQGARSGIAAIMGQWPGDETDEEFAAAVNALS